jgi:hypothetical protein
MLSFMLLLAAFVSLIARILTRPSMIALAQQAWSLLKEADGALKHATLYAPEAEYYRRRAAPYFFFISNVLWFTIMAVYILVFLVALPFAFRPGVPWYAPVIILSFLGVMIPWGRIHLASASWAWHAIKTGEDRPPRAPQV